MACFTVMPYDPLEMSARTSTKELSAEPRPNSQGSRAPSRDDRRRKRLKSSLSLHVRPFDARYGDLDEVGKVIDFTRDGLFFRALMPHYFVGMRLIVTFPYGEKIRTHRRMLATVVRIDRMEDGTRGVAISVLL